MTDRIRIHSFPRLESLQGLRAIAIICIFLHHTGLKGMEPYGPFGVSVFLMLSGFLMGGSYLGNNKEAKFGFGFVFKKIINLYPLHIVTMLSIAVYYIITASFSLWPCLYGFLVNILMILPYCLRLPIEYFNGPSWYLGVCVITYLAFPLILKMMKGYRNRKVAYIVITISAIFILLISFCAKHFSATIQKDLTYYLPLFRIPEFVIGCNMGYLYVAKDKTSISKRGYLSIVGVSLTLASWYVFDKGLLFFGQEYFRNTALFLLPSVFLIYSIANNHTLTNLLESKILVIIGDLSPYVFLIHVPVLWYTRLLFRAWDNDWRIVVLSFLFLVYLHFYTRVSFIK